MKKATICYENELQKRENAEQNGCLYKIKSAKTIANEIQATDGVSIDEKTSETRSETEIQVESKSELSGTSICRGHPHPHHLLQQKH